MSVVTTACNLLDPAARMSLAAAAPERLQHRPEGATYLDLRGLPLEPLPDIDEERIAELCRVVRGLIFAPSTAAKLRPRSTRHSSAIRSSSMSGSGSNGSPRRSRYVAPSGRCCRRSGAAAASVIRAPGSNRLQAVVTTDINVPPRGQSALFRVGCCPDRVVRLQWPNANTHRPTLSWVFAAETLICIN